MQKAIGMLAGKPVLTSPAEKHEQSSFRTESGILE
jgi:hypothetical protein